MCNYYKAFFLKLVNFGVDIIKVEWEAIQLFFSGFRKRGLMRDYFCPVRSTLVPFFSERVEDGATIKFKDIKRTNLTFFKEEKCILDMMVQYSRITSKDN